MNGYVCAEQPACPTGQGLMNATSLAKGMCQVLPTTTTSTTTTTTTETTTTSTTNTATTTTAANTTTLPETEANSSSTTAGPIVTATGSAPAANGSTIAAVPGDRIANNDSAPAGSGTGGNANTSAAGSAGGATGKTAAGADALPWPTYPGCSAEQAAPLWGLGCGACEASRNTNGEQAKAALCPKCLPSCRVAVLGADSAAGIAAFHKFPDRCECHGMRSLGDVHDAAHCCTPYVEPTHVLISDSLWRHTASVLAVV